jgi:hypothetical protein
MKWAWSAQRDDRGKRLSSRRWGGAVGAGVASLVAVVIVIGVVTLVIEEPLGPSIVAAACGVFGLLLCFVVIAAPPGPDPVIEAAKDKRVCASCRYSLTGCRAEADGCTVCPECGAAWRLPGESAGPPSSS